MLAPGGGRGVVVSVSAIATEDRRFDSPSRECIHVSVFVGNLICFVDVNL
jgi:hypothetical protein